MKFNTAGCLRVTVCIDSLANACTTDTLYTVSAPISNRSIYHTYATHGLDISFTVDLMVQMIRKICCCIVRHNSEQNRACTNDTQQKSVKFETLFRDFKILRILHWGYAIIWDTIRKVENYNSGHNQMPNKQSHMYRTASHHARQCEGGFNKFDIEVRVEIYSLF